MITYNEKEARATDQAYLTPDIVKQRMRTLDALQLIAGERVLDVGCGTGLLAYDMAQLVGSGGEVVGIDLSEDMLAYAERRCAELEQVRYQMGESEALEAPANHFDAAACTQVLLYVADIQKALAELHRVLKPGGRIVILETDWRGVVISAPDDELTRRVLAAWDSAVASPNLPPRLTPLLADAGFTGIRAEAIPLLNRSFSPGNFSHGMAIGFARHAVRGGGITPEEKKAWITELEAQEARGAYFFCVNRFLFTAVKG